MQADPAKWRDYPFFEAGFFGNLFQEKPVGYVCTGDAPALPTRHLRSVLRVCSLAEANSPATQHRSRCGFVIADPCQDRAFVQDGADYSAELLNIYVPAPK